MSLYARYAPVILGGSGSGGGGITSINADTSVSQFLVVGTAGTDFAIVDNGTGTHTFNLPTASASNRGALSSADWTTFNSKQAALSFGNLTDAGTDGITIGNGTGAVIGSGTTISQHVADTSHNGYLASADWNTFNGKQASGNYATSGTGDVSWSAPSGAGPVTTSLVATTNATLTTLSALTTAGSLATVGTVTSGAWNATTIAIAHGGTGQTSAAAAFAALSPLTTQGDIIYETSAPAPARLAIGSSGNVLTVSGGVPVWAAPATAGTVTSVGLSIPGIFTISNSPVTSAGTLTATPSGTSGGVPYFSSSTALASSGALTANGVVYGGGSGAAPAATAAGTTGNVLISTTSAAPSWGSVPAAAMPALTGDVTTSAGAVATTIVSVGATYTSSTTSVANSGNVTIKMPTKVYDTNNAYSASTGQFTVPVAGKYIIAAAVAMPNTNVGVKLQLSITQNSSIVLGTAQFAPFATNDGYASVSGIVNCSASDTIGLTLSQNDAGSQSLTGTTQNFFSIQRLGN